MDIAPPMAVLPMPEMSVNCVPSWFQLAMVWLIGDVTMPDTLLTVLHTFFCAYLTPRPAPRTGSSRGT